MPPQLKELRSILLLLIMVLVVEVLPSSFSSILKTCTACLSTVSPEILSVHQACVSNSATLLISQLTVTEVYTWLTWLQDRFGTFLPGVHRGLQLLSTPTIPSVRPVLSLSPTAVYTLPMPPPATFTSSPSLPPTRSHHW